MVNMWTMCGGLSLAFLLALRYGREPARRLIVFGEWFRSLHKWPVMLFVFVAAMMVRSNADAGVVDFVGGLIGSVGGVVADKVGDVFEAVRAAILKAFADLICLLIEMFGGVILTLFAAIPDSVTSSVVTVKTYLDIVNSWVPVTDAAVWFAAYLVFLLFQIPVKLAVKLLVPTVG